MFLLASAAAFAPPEQVGLPQCQTFLGTAFDGLRLAFLPGPFDTAQCCEKCGELTIPGANCGARAWIHGGTRRPSPRPLLVALQVHIR